jgi:hypothetical protein
VLQIIYQCIVIGYTSALLSTDAVALIVYHHPVQKVKMHSLVQFIYLYSPFGCMLLVILKPLSRRAYNSLVVQVDGYMYDCLRSLSYVIYKWLLYLNSKCCTSRFYVYVRIKHTIISVYMALVCSCFCQKSFQKLLFYTLLKIYLQL